MSVLKKTSFSNFHTRHTSGSQSFAHDSPTSLPGSYISRAPSCILEDEDDLNRGSTTTATTTSMAEATSSVTTTDLNILRSLLPVLREIQDVKEHDALKRTAEELRQTATELQEIRQIVPALQEIQDARDFASLKKTTEELRTTIQQNDRDSASMRRTTQELRDEVQRDAQDYAGLRKATVELRETVATMQQSVLELQGSLADLNKRIRDDETKSRTLHYNQECRIYNAHYAHKDRFRTLRSLRTHAPIANFPSNAGQLEALGLRETNDILRELQWSERDDPGWAKTSLAAAIGAYSAMPPGSRH